MGLQWTLRNGADVVCGDTLFLVLILNVCSRALVEQAEIVHRPGQQDAQAIDFGRCGEQPLMSGYRAIPALLEEKFVYGLIKAEVASVFELGRSIYGFPGLPVRNRFNVDPHLGRRFAAP
ncbi:hypothetical protein CVV68_03735 [Arthrobacter livingstonensis]|uniref:Uncharacterized protein n=1 Tax=Arthrobacter livingstonensis TaxID=670078 RepID=A0A2V5LDH2_9MICC|nr:hypothetical protein [Arthrobacter livingstonensis]PYI68932.1 hypothetical protein CVV68_03735 [Arthrobacter livingstonensis]